MQFIAHNVEYNSKHLIAKNMDNADCFLVATYNAMILQGKSPNYEEMRKKSMLKNWYEPTVGFYIQYVTHFLRTYSIKHKKMPDNSTTWTVRDKVKNGSVLIILAKPKDGSNGHAMLAVKGNRGVRIVNPANYKGWRTICKMLKDGKICIDAYEIKINESSMVEQIK